MERVNISPSSTLNTGLNIIYVEHTKLNYPSLNSEITSSYEKGVSQYQVPSHSDRNNTTNALKTQRSAIVQKYAIQLA